ncbi:META domain-containing protein [Oceanicola sp. 502str15]|uniref:META domain-containing protein n=1 Tax=Oceanicola sp. 502str15 TaxID=2696061 RepID=UPI002095FDB3|nr:META domain-containing protein [Oceanicola sp. 502str15]MCO6384987.1 META domain-containing protein [Oceanicola sp. 502str15]
MKNIALTALLALTPLAAACKDETVTGYAPGIYRLEEIDGTSFEWGATLNLTEAGRISGQAPCNGYSAEQTAPYPWFKPGPIVATRMACLHMNGEAEFFEALGAMTLAEGSGPVLILSNEAGREMVFRREE